MAEQSPTVYVIAGPNGAGKTTFAMRFLPDYVDCREFLNADLIATGLSPFAPESQALAAGRLMLKRLQECIDARVTFAMETTLSGRPYAKTFGKMKALGYRVVLSFLWLPNADLAVQRVGYRVSQGGHNVPEEDIRRRWASGIVNIAGDYRRLADEWWLFDALSSPAKAIATDVDGETTVLDATLYEQFLHCVENQK